MGPGWLSCIQWNFSIEDTIGTQLAVLYREVSLMQRQRWDVVQQTTKVKHSLGTGIDMIDNDDDMTTSQGSMDRWQLWSSSSVP